MHPEHNAFYDGKNVRILSIDKMLPGDIILTRNRWGTRATKRLMSTAISAAGSSDFSHALICQQPPTLIEAIDTGVSTVTMSRCFFHDTRDVRVMRYNDPKAASNQRGGQGYS